MHAPTERYACDDCSEETQKRHAYLKRQYLWRHLLCRHLQTPNADSLRCDDCAYSSKVRWDVQQHALEQHLMRRNHNTTRRFACDVCAYTSRYKNALSQHVRQRHGTPAGVHFRCARCRRSFSAYKCVRDHIRSCHRRVRYACDECGGVWVGKQKLLRHVLAALTQR